MPTIEEPSYTILQQQEAIQIRSYPRMVIAKTITSGERNKAISKGFRHLANYIFGDNSQHKKIPMTAPVLQQKLGSTESGSEARWQITFIMPSQEKLTTLPQPNDSLVNLEEQKEEKYVAIRFSGFNTESNFSSHEKKLNAYIKLHGLKTENNAIYALYNPPWTLPFFKRYDIMFALQEKSS